MTLSTTTGRPVRHIYRWDLDKTYLDTDFRLRRIWRVPFESAASKRNVPGAVALLRELSTGQDPSGRVQVVFISGSPHQMRRAIEEKFRLDGLVPDQLYLKPNLQNFVSLRWRAIREQVGYKLPLLLEARVDVPSHVEETCFGDDSESDAFIYSMYADLVSGQIGDFTLREMMTAAGAYPDAILRARDARRRIVPADAVQSIFIHLAIGTPPERFHPYGPRVIPIWDYFQAALCLYGRGHLTPAAVVNVAHDMIARYNYTPDRLGQSFQDILRRGHFPRIASRRLGEQLDQVQFPPPLPPRGEVLETLRVLANEVPDDVIPPPGPTAIDYPALIQTLRNKVVQERVAKAAEGG
jgi:hypothetical protein